MAKINIPITLPTNMSGVSSFNIRYARVDNTTTPTYSTINNITGGLYIIQNVNNGQYNVGVTANYASGISCPEVMQTTPACSGINAFSVSFVSGNFVVSYATTSAYVILNISYPNGGSYSAQYANGASISVAPPLSVYGAFSFTLTPVCDVDTNFIGQPTAPAVVTLQGSSLGIITVQAVDTFIGTLTAVTGVTGFTLSSDISAGGGQTGTHGALTTINVTLTLTSIASGGVAYLAIDNINQATAIIHTGDTSVTLTKSMAVDANQSITITLDSNV
jgi:hypothetical protein